MIQARIYAKKILSWYHKNTKSILESEAIGIAKMPPKDTFPQKIKRLTETYFLNDGHEKYASFEAKKSVSDQQIRLGEKMVWGGLALVGVITESGVRRI